MRGITTLCITLMLLIAFGLPASAAKNNLEIFPGHKWEIPNNIEHRVSDATLEHYYEDGHIFASRNLENFMSLTEAKIHFCSTRDWKLIRKLKTS